MEMARLLRIRGKVQGVTYRESMCREANRIGVTGWVRNRSDRSVEAFVQGTASQVEEILQWARVGPPFAKVDDITDEPTTPDAVHDTFERRETC